MRAFINLIETVSRDDNRVFLAYCKQHGIDISQLSSDEFDQHYAKAMADRDRYPIPQSSPEFLYHGTKASNLASIARNGLTPSTATATSNITLLPHVRGRVFLTTTIENAEFYALRAAKRKPQALLRVARATVADDLTPDALDEESFFISRVIPPSQIEVWNGKAWVPVRPSAS